MLIAIKAVSGYLMGALLKKYSAKTVLFIAHRLSSIKNFDRIAVLEKGRIVEEGTHNELLKKGNIYSSFWKNQKGISNKKCK